jgi:chemotaxis protein CheZ
MAEPRKVFRIEQAAAARLERSVDTTLDGLRLSEIMLELGALRAALAAALPGRFQPIAASEPAGVARLTSELNLIAGAIRGGDDEDSGKKPSGSNGARAETPMSRVEHELHAVVNGTEQATQKILTAAEEIDATANTLSAALDGKIEQGMALDIQDLVIQIFEACNFQDLIGQRIAKVMASLKFVEDHIARVLEEIKTASAAGKDLHGPRLDGDDGHASQVDIDAMFSDRRAAGGK